MTARPDIALVRSRERAYTLDVQAKGGVDYRARDAVALCDWVRTLEAALDALVDDEQCTLDPDGDCQTHFFGNPCEVVAARALLAQVPVDAEGT